MKRKILLSLGILLLLAGLAVLLYPSAKTAALRGRERDSINAFEQYLESAKAEEAASQTESPEDGPLPAEQEADAAEPGRIFPELWEACVAFNEQLPETQRSSYTEDSLRRPSIRLSDYGWEKEIFGYISIPAADIEAPLYLGASSANMDRGAAILGQTSLPIGGESTHCVIAGHRTWSGAIQFKGLEQLTVGDRVYITNPWETLTYEVIVMKTILPDAADEIMVQKGRDLMTIFTCTVPNTQRLIVVCERVPNKDEKHWKTNLLPWILNALFEREDVIKHRWFVQNIKERTDCSMQFKVQIYFDGTPIDPSDVPSLKINSATVQRIVNRVARRCAESQTEALRANTVGILGGYEPKTEAANG